MTTTLYICDTCRYSADERELDGRRGGAIFAEKIAEQLRARPLEGLAIKPTSCLMACTRHCTVHLRAPGKINYIIGDFTATLDSAATLLDYIEKYQRSDTGQVPYSTWPQGIKGHFVARTPPHESDH